MVSLDDLKDLILYKKQFYLPIDLKDKLHGSAIFLFTPSYESSVLSMTKSYMVNRRYFESYYMEKDIVRLIHNESLIPIDSSQEYIVESDDSESTTVLNEFLRRDSISNMAGKSHSVVEFYGRPDDIKKVKLEFEGPFNSYVKRCFTVMNKSYPDKVTIIVTDNPEAPQEFTDTTVSIYTPKALKKIYPRVNYDNYIYYILQLYAVYTLKPRHGYYIEHSKPLDGLAEPAAIVLSKIKEKELTQRKDNTINFERVFLYIIKEYGMNHFIEIIASNNLKAIMKYNREYINKTYAKNDGIIYTESMKELMELYEGSIPVSTPKKPDLKLDSLKIVKNANFRMKLKMRKPIYHLNALTRDMEKSTDKTKPNINLPSLPNVQVKKSEQSKSDDSSKDKEPEESSSDDPENNNDSEVKTEQLNVLTQNDYVSSGDYVYLFEDSIKYNAILKKALYNDRIKNNKQVLRIYSKVKSDLPFIKYTFTNIARYKNRNLFVDLSYYIESFFKNMNGLNTTVSNTPKIFNTYLTLMERLLKDAKVSKYKKKTIFIPVLEWKHTDSAKMWIYRNDINPISAIYYMIKNNLSLLHQIFGDVDVVFLGGNNYFKVNFNEVDFRSDINKTKFITLINRIITLGENNSDPDPVGEFKDSPKGIAMELIDKVETSQNVTITNVSKIATLKTDVDIVKPTTPINILDTTKAKENDKKKDTVKPKSDDTISDNATTEETKKDAIVDAITQASENSTTSDEAMKKLNSDEFKEMILALQNDSSENTRVSKVQASKVIAVQNEFYKKKVAGRSVEDLLKGSKASETLPVTKLKVASINEDWQNMTFMNFDKDYDLNSDIIRMLDSMKDWTYPIAVRNIDIKDNSTSEDILDLWTIECQDSRGSKFILRVDIPKFINGSNFLKLRGNEKTLMIQSALLPVIKTGADECQIIGTGGYNKIFVRRFGARVGQSLPSTSNLIKALNKYIQDNKDIKITMGDNTKVCTKYDLPMDYIDLSQILNNIETKNTKIYFNQDELREKYQVDDTKGIPIAIRKVFSSKDKKSIETIYYYNGTNGTLSQDIVFLLIQDVPRFGDIYSQIKVSGARYSYSKASILNKKIPVVLICAYLEGLVKTMNKAGIKYMFKQKLDKEDRYTDAFDYIKFSDGFLIYESTYSSSLLMNGLKDHDTESYSLKDINNKLMYLDFFNAYGNFVDNGLENSYDCMLDPITKEILEKCNLPTDYVGVMLYANSLLADNKYVRHIDQAGRRWRRKELIAGYFYKALSSAYQDYSRSLRNNRKGSKMEMKQSAIIDLITSKDPATADLSVNNAINDLECANTVTNKGLVGMNVARGYTINTRGYDESMLNLVGMDTGFSGNVGINRQATINANIEGKRGFVKTIGGDTKKLSVASTLTITEAMTPFGCTHDDPQRTLMSFVQTSKHMIRCDTNDPTLVTTGADEALPYLVSDIFAFKAKKDGKVVEIVKEGFGKQNYMIVEYKDKTYDYINLSEEVKKNSDGGYYVSMQLDTDLTKGKTFKAGDVLAYDPKSFSKSMGESGNLAANVGTLAKVAIINTDEGFEDSAAVTESFAKKLGTDIIQSIETRVSKGSNIFIEKNVGDEVMEGDTLFSYQTDFDDEVVNTLLKNLTTDSDQISELGKTPIKTKYTGIVDDIVIYRTCETDEMSPSLKKFVGQYESKVLKTKKVYDKYKLDTMMLPQIGKVPEVGRTKNLDDAVLIIYYIKYNDKLSTGDKIVYYSANKGTIKYIIPNSQEPYTDFRPNEHIESFMSLSSISGRMTFSIAIFAAVSKLMVELDRSIKDLAGIPYDDSMA